MRLPKFEYLQPTSREEAFRLLQEHGSRAQLVAGGTDLYPRMKYGLAHPDVLISLRGLSTTPPSEDPNGDLHIDALMTLSDLAGSQTIVEKAPLLSEAALSVASNQIRHMGTLGGNLCQENRCYYYNQTHTFQFVEQCFKRNGDLCYLIPKGKKCWAVFSSDTAPALISLGASIPTRTLLPRISRTVTTMSSPRQMLSFNLRLRTSMFPSLCLEYAHNFKRPPFVCEF